MQIFDKNFKEIFLSQILSIIGGLIAGTILVIYTDKILLLPGILIILPGLLEMRGNISGSFASRLSSGLYLGIVNPKKIKTKIIRGNIMASFLLTVILTFILGLIAFLVNGFISNIFSPSIILLPVLVGIVANTIEIPLTLFTTFYFFRKGHDPNNIMGPFVTSIGDLTTVISILVGFVILI